MTSYTFDSAMQLEFISDPIKSLCLGDSKKGFEIESVQAKAL